jgi:hypothetical protein
MLSPKGYHMQRYGTRTRSDGEKPVKSRKVCQRFWVDRVGVKETSLIPITVILSRESGNATPLVSGGQ